MKPIFPLVPEILPAVVKWAEQISSQVQAEGMGIPLNEVQLADARVVGVKHPEKIRLLKVRRLPPLPDILEEWSKWMYIEGAPAGCLGYSILLTRSHYANRRTVAHEMAHTAQFERMQTMAVFLETYLNECFSMGYFNSPCEKEANEKAGLVAMKYPAKFMPADSPVRNLLYRPI